MAPSRERPTAGRLRCLALLLALVATACSSGKLPGLYRIDIQQGNIVTPEMLSEVEMGMDKRQVRFLLGTPLVADAFHQNRWDYVYSYQKGGRKRVQQHISLYFENERLTRIEGALDPEMDYHTVVDARETVIDVPPRKKRGFFASLVPAFLRSDDRGSVPQPSPPDTEAAATGGSPPASTEDAAREQDASAGDVADEPVELSESYAPNVDSDAVKQDEADTEPEPAGDEESLEEIFGGYGRGLGDTGR